jgi:hypothetical protein
MPKHMTPEEYEALCDRVRAKEAALRGHRRFRIFVQPATKEDRRVWRKLYRRAVNWCGVLWGGKR